MSLTPTMPPPQRCALYVAERDGSSWLINVEDGAVSYAEVTVPRIVTLPWRDALDLLHGAGYRVRRIEGERVFARGGWP